MKHEAPESSLAASRTAPGRPLTRDEVPGLFRIDRAETVDGIYRVRDGALVREALRVEVAGWPPGEAEKYTPLLLDCFDRGGWFRGCFEGDAIVAAAVLDPRPLGTRGDRLQLKFLHTSRAFRGRGLAGALFAAAKEEARRRGARALYVSATETVHTVEFYLRLGCALAREVDPELFALEPEDVHLECPLAPEPS